MFLPNFLCAWDIYYGDSEWHRFEFIADVENNAIQDIISRPSIFERKKANFFYELCFR